MSGDRESDALSKRYHRGVDSDDVAAQVRERASAVSRVYRRVGLNETFQDEVRPGKRSSEGADHAHRNSRTTGETECVAYREHDLPCLELLRVAQTGSRQVRSFNPDECNVRRRVSTDHFANECPSVLERDLDLRSAVDDVIVSCDVALRVDYDARGLTLERNDTEAEVPR